MLKEIKFAFVLFRITGKWNHTRAVVLKAAENEASCFFRGPRTHSRLFSTLPLLERLKRSLG